MSDIDWLVIPGGPGLSRKYLEEGFGNAFKNHKLHFFDPLGSPESSQRFPCIEDMINQVKFVANELHLKKYGLISHSFGNYVALRLIEQEERKIEGLIMISPMPFQSKDWRDSLNKIVKKVTKEDMQTIQDLENNPSDGSELFHKLYPYYTGKAGKQLLLDIPFDIQACNAISGQVIEYDESELMQKSLIPMAQIVGDKDPFFLRKNILDDRTIIIKGAGHYPFLEDNAQFCQAVTQVDKKLCQKKNQR